ncbi:MAG: hypothetical protein AAGK02_00590 [Pseudomonadota bacterium]
MDADLVLIFGFILTALVVIGFTVNGIVGKVLRHKREMHEFERLSNQKANSENSEMVEERLRVLERIATDRKPDLATEIENLRELDRVGGDS